jgi:hypothetical protein
MKLEEKTLNVLKNYSQINVSLLFREGDELSTISPSSTVLSRAKVPNKFKKRFAIYELPKLLGGISLANAPSLDFKENAVIISDEKSNCSSSITYAAETSIKTIPQKVLDKDWQIMPSVDVTIKLTEADLKTVIKAAGVYGLPVVSFVGDGQNVYLKAFEPKNQTGNSFNVKIGETDKTFSVNYVVENLLKLMPGDYTVEISSKLLSHFIGDDIEYWIAVETSSTFD